MKRTSEERNPTGKKKKEKMLSVEMYPSLSLGPQRIGDCFYRGERGVCVCVKYDSVLSNSSSYILMVYLKERVKVSET